MNYTIIRNDKLTRVNAQGAYIHNDRRSKGHSKENRKFEQEFEQESEQEFEQEFENKELDIRYEYKNKIKSLEKEKHHLHKIIDKFYETVKKFIDWICHKFGIWESKELVKNFQEDKHIFIDPVKQIEYENELLKNFEIEL